MIYVLHFERPYKHARHYTGFAENSETLQRRLDQHLAGQGSRLIQVITDEGIGFEVGAILDGDRKVERRLKNTAHPERICVVCKNAKKGETNDGTVQRQDARR